MSLKLAGHASVDSEVDAKHRALRVSQRPLDVGALGAYRVSALSGQIAATLASSSALFSLRWGNNTGKKMVLTDLRVGVIVDGTITTAVAMALEAVIARGFTASDTGGTALTLTGNNNKLKTDMGASLVTDARIASTAALGAGTRTLDTQGIGMAICGSGTTQGALTAMGKTVLFQPKAGEENPAVFAQDEGFIIRSLLTGPATGTFRLLVEAAWAEMSSYDNVGQ